MVDYSIYHFDYAIAPLVGAAIVSGISALGSTIASAIARKREQRRQNQMNQEQAKYQNSLNLEQWNKENEYNTPANQMARLKQAGVNPRLWWSNGSNTSASSPTLSAPEQQYTAVGGEIGKGLSDAFGSAINTVNEINQIKNQEAQRDLISAQIRHYDMLTKLNGINADIKSTENLMRTIDLNYYDLSQRQRVYGKQLAMNNMLANYLNNFGADTLTLNDHNMLSVDPLSFKETPMTSLRRKQISSAIALNDAKAIESAWNSKAKKAGIQWLGQRMYSEKLRQNLLNAEYGISYFKRQNEISKNDILEINKDLMRTQVDFMKEQVKRKSLENFNYFPVLGELDLSNYLKFLYK